MNMSRPCSCQGNNERCYKCFGSGYLSGSGSSFTLPVSKPKQDSGRLFSRSRVKIRKGTGKSTPKQAQKQSATPLSIGLPIAIAEPSASAPRTMLSLPENAAKPPRLKHNGVFYNRCVRCGFYVMSDRLMVHDDVYVERHSKTQPPVHSVLGLSRLQHTDSHATCPRCLRPVGRHKLKRHLVRTHLLGESEADQLALAVLAPVPLRTEVSASANTSFIGTDGLGYTKCSACDKEVRSERFLVHVEICPAIGRRKRFAAVGLAAPPKPVEPPVAPRRPITPHAAAPVNPLTMQSCDVCKCSVRAGDMARHLQRAHPTVMPASGSVSVKTTGTVHSEGGSVRYDKDGGTDGGKFLGYLAREDGRFGSMPSYDDYGDEGTAD